MHDGFEKLQINSNVENRRRYNPIEMQRNGHYESSHKFTSITNNLTPKHHSRIQGHDDENGKSIEFGALEFWAKLRHDLKHIPWEHLKTVKLKNDRALPGCAYTPTEVCNYFIIIF